MSDEVEQRVQPEQDKEGVQEPKERSETPEAGNKEGKRDQVMLQQMEQMEEAKLKAKYPQAMRPGGSAFLQKRLNKGQKYFDSGDYNMAKAKCNKSSRVQILQQPTGEAIPTPDNLPTRKTSLVQSKLAAGLS